MFRKLENGVQHMSRSLGKYTVIKKSKGKFQKTSIRNLKGFRVINLIPLLYHRFPHAMGLRVILGFIPLIFIHGDCLVSSTDLQMKLNCVSCLEIKSGEAV